MARAHPQNAPGPFYVAVGDCTSCGVPAELAPDIFGCDICAGSESAQCFVRNQPHTLRAIKTIVQVIKTAEVECIRYRGGDRRIEAELDRQGLPHLCDPSSE